VRHERGRWFVSFTVEQDITRPAPSRPGIAAGVDLGIKTLAVIADSTGRTFEVPNPRHMSRELRKIRRLSRAVSRRRGPDRRTGRQPSNRWKRADAARNRAAARVAGQRKDSIHKLTARLAAVYGTIVVEDLHVAGMVRNRRLARHVADASFAEIRRQLAYKTQWHGGNLIVADRWFASSKTCSGCGAVKAKLALSERTYCCTACGTLLDRDVNAAVNLARLAGSGPDSNGRGADRQTPLRVQVAVKRQPGTRQRDQTGTAAPQGTAAA
jgi:putative transposase